MYFQLFSSLASFLFVGWLFLQFGALAVFIRQTNIIWLLFVACSGFMEVTAKHREARKKMGDFSTWDSVGDSSRPIVSSDINLSSSLNRRGPSSNVVAVKHTADCFSEDSVSSPSGSLSCFLPLLCN